MEKKSYLYEVEVIFEGGEVCSPVFTDCAMTALAAIKILRSAGLECRMYRKGERV